MSSDLIERLKAVELDDPQAIDALLVEAITALSPTLPDDGLRQALEFYDKVCAATTDEKIAVGQDHWNWLLEESRKAADMLERLQADLMLEKKWNEVEYATREKLQQRIEQLRVTVTDLTGVALDSDYGRYYLKEHYPSLLSKEDKLVERNQDE